MNYTGSTMLIHVVRRVLRPANAPTTYFQFSKTASIDLLFASHSSKVPATPDTLLVHDSNYKYNTFSFYTQQNYSVNCNATKNVPILPPLPPAPTPQNSTKPTPTPSPGVKPIGSTKSNSTDGSNRTEISSALNNYHHNEKSALVKWVCFIACFLTMYIMRN